jgi:redox-sensitive bicupin YhaK (pirin superfamily)
MSTEQARHLGKTINGQRTSDGAGVKLKRIISPSQNTLFDPFLLFDEFASEEAADYIGGFPEHPHRGFETVTYMLEGAMLHRDHMGNEGHLRAGDVQWMTAAHGIIHSEMPEQENGLLHGFQLWLNLPATEKMKPPHYQDIAATDIPSVALADGGFVKVIAGTYQGINGAVTGAVTQPLYVDIGLEPHQSLDIPVDVAHTAVVYVYQGEVSVADGLLKTGQLGLLLEGDHIQLASTEHAAKLLLLAAKPLHEPVVQSGPFVMNTVAEIEQAFRDYRDGVLTVLPA